MPPPLYENDVRRRVEFRCGLRGKTTKKYSKRYFSKNYFNLKCLYKYSNVVFQTLLPPFQAKEDKQNVQDPVIQSILESSRRRQQAATSKPLANWVPNGFVPTVNLF